MERKIIRRPKRPGESVDFEAAFNEHQPVLFRYVHRLVGDPDVAADVVQESFVRLLRHPLPEDEARRWLFTVATNLVRDGARMKTRRSRLREEHVEQPASPPRPDQDLEAAEARNRVRGALDRIPARDREMLLMREEGFKYAEIARVVDVAPGSVGTLLARALERLSGELGGRAAAGGAGASVTGETPE